MPLPRFATLAPERRAAILGAAAEEFARAGLEGASYNRIIASAGVSKGAMYYYFDNKEDLFLTVLADLAARATAAIGGPGPFSSAAGFWRELRGLCVRSMAFFGDDPIVAGLGKRLVTVAPDSPLASVVAGYTGRIEAFTADLLRRGQAVGAVRDDLPLELLAHLLTGVGEAMDRWLLTRWDRLTPAELALVPDQIVDLLVRIATPAPRPAKERHATKTRKKRT